MPHYHLARELVGKLSELLTELTTSFKCAVTPTWFTLPRVRAGFPIQVLRFFCDNPIATNESEIKPLFGRHFPQGCYYSCYYFCLK